MSSGKCRPFCLGLNVLGEHLGHFFAKLANVSHQQLHLLLDNVCNETRIFWLNIYFVLFCVN